MMPYKLVLTANAQKDIQQAIDWEDKRKEGLGKRFFEDLESRFRDVALFPLAATVRYDNVRCSATHTFQYLIHYVVDTDRSRVVIFRVLHTSRRPGG